MKRCALKFQSYSIGMMLCLCTCFLILFDQTDIEFCRLYISMASLSHIQSSTPRVATIGWVLEGLWLGFGGSRGEVGLSFPPDYQDRLHRFVLLADFGELWQSPRFMLTFRSLYYPWSGYIIIAPPSAVR